MKKDIICVTDHIVNYEEVEEKILGDYFSKKLNNLATILLVWHKTIDENYLREYPNVRAIVRYGVGFDNIDLECCKRRKITVVNNPDYGIDEVADTALAMILNLTRNINGFQNFAKKNCNSWLGENISAKVYRTNTLKLGIIGFGRIGSSLGRKFAALSPYVSFYDPYLKSGTEKVFGFKRYFTISEILRTSDIISINTPLNEETKNMVDEDFIQQMRKGSYLINVSRGPIVKNSSIIYKALKDYHLQGYATDVWSNEPPLEEDILYNACLNNFKFQGRVIINPHTAYYSETSIVECREKACKICLNLIKGEKLLNKII